MHGDLWRYFLTNPGFVIVKMPHYFPIYESHFARFRGTDCTVLEIGVAGGGSLQMWKAYFGERCNVVGLDVNPRCAERVEDRIRVFVGDQADPNFLAKVIDEIGPPTIVIDDGSHRTPDATKSYEFLYPRMASSGVYVVEDLHTAYSPEFNGGVRHEGTFIERTKALIDELHAAYANGAPELAKSTHSIHVYDSIVVIEREPKKILPALYSWGRDAPPTK